MQLSIQKFAENLTCVLNLMHGTKTWIINVYVNLTPALSKQSPIELLGSRMHAAKGIKGKLSNPFGNESQTNYNSNNAYNPE